MASTVVFRWNRRQTGEAHRMTLGICRIWIPFVFQRDPCCVPGCRFVRLCDESPSASNARIWWQFPNMGVTRETHVWVNIILSIYLCRWSLSVLTMDKYKSCLRHKTLSIKNLLHQPELHWFRSLLPPLLLKILYNSSEISKLRPLHKQCPDFSCIHVVAGQREFMNVQTGYTSMARHALIAL